VTQKVAKLLVDDFIKFKGCVRHVAPMGTSGMRDFIDDRQELLRKISQFAEPDFAQPERLLVKARLPYDPEDEVEDEWKKLSGNSFGHMTSNEWNDCHEVIGRIFTGGDDSDVEDGGSDVENGENVDRYFEMEQDDVF
jgi:hypothetical protein